jgi:hypothetical protein
MKNLALRLAGIIFLLVSALHFYRYYNHIQVTFDHYSIPLSWSLYGGFIVLALAIFMFVARRR